MSTAVGASLALAAALTACGGAEGPGSPNGSSAKLTFPDYYPADYADLVDESRKESGKLSLYTNLAEPNLAPLIKGFQEKYPWISVSSAGDMSAEEVIQRYNAEASRKATDADLIITAVAGEVWEDVIGGTGILDYQSVEDKYYDESSNPHEGLYAFASDPLVMFYNPQVLPEKLHPTGLKDLAKIVEENPSEFPDQSIITYDVSGFGYAGHKALAEKFPWAWDFYESIAPHTLAGPIGGGDQLERVTRGESLVSVMSSGRTAYTGAVNAEGLIEVVLPDDATIFYNRGEAISKYTEDPASAKLFLDYTLSEEGQALIGEGESTPVRDIPVSESVPRTVKSITAEVGEENVVFTGLEKTPGQKEFVKRFNKVFGLAGTTSQDDNA
ncbi:extracellular solute-binding protein [Streptomyces sp. NPDC050625]|uniref:ABC transporter substrate-binding protein n=1 Tax=Streptomyces sp. NPDC050625 TaxID=3154629 RepID=UPI0034361D1C